MTNRIGRLFFQIAVALLAVAAAALLTHFIPQLQKRSSLFLFIAAVILCTRIADLGSGIAALVVGCVFIIYLVFPPFRSFSIKDPDDLFRISVFVLVSAMILSMHASRSATGSALRASEQRLMLALDSAYMGVWDYNLLTRKFWWSKTLETIYGRADDEFPKTYGRFFGFIHFDDQPMFNRAITRTIDEGTDYEVDHRIVLPDQSIRWVNTRGRVFFNKHSRAERIVAVATDITEKKQDERQQIMTREATESRFTTVA